MYVYCEKEILSNSKIIRTNKEQRVERLAFRIFASEVELVVDLDPCADSHLIPFHRAPKMAFRARIAQHIEIHHESRFPSLSPSAENRATRFDPRNNPSLFLSPLSHAGSQPPISTPLAPNAVLFYSRGTSAFASAATPFNLAPSPIPLCPYLICLSLASDRFARTCLAFFFFSRSLSPSGSLRMFLHFMKHQYL